VQVNPIKNLGFSIIANKTPFHFKQACMCSNRSNIMLSTLADKQQVSEPNKVGFTPKHFGVELL
jgi:hypothetical protein